MKAPSKLKIAFGLLMFAAGLGLETAAVLAFLSTGYAAVMPTSPFLLHLAATALIAFGAALAATARVGFTQALGLSAPARPCGRPRPAVLDSVTDGGGARGAHQPRQRTAG